MRKQYNFRIRSALPFFKTRGQKALWASLLSGTLLVLSFPKYGGPVTAWIALLPLFYAITGVTTREAFKYGFLAGFTAFNGTLYWIVYVVVKYGNLPVYTGIFALLMLVSYLALYLGIFSSAIVYLRKQGFREIYTAPIIWVILEYLKSNLFTGFPWENLGHSQHSFLSLIQISDIVGVYGISFVIVLANRAVFDLIVSPKDSIKMPVIHSAIALTLIFAIILYGTWRIKGISAALTSASNIPVTIVQGNIDQNIKWNPAYQTETMRIYRSLTLEAVPEEGGLIIWPETATPFYFQQNNHLSKMVMDVALTAKSWLLFGSPSYGKEPGGIEYFNSAFLVSPQGTIAGKYDKVHLVPYGEYVPLRKYFPFISKLVVGIGDFKSGQGYIPIESPWGRAGVLICYEGIFSYAGRAYSNQGAQLLINITNDAWFGNTSAPYQHLSMAVFRAVENRLYLLRAANTGISAIIDPTGAIVHKTELFEPAAIRSQVKSLTGNTFYAAHGDLFALICLALGVILMVISLVRRVKR